MGYAIIVTNQDTAEPNVLILLEQPDHSKLLIQISSLKAQEEELFWSILLQINRWDLMVKEDASTLEVKEAAKPM